MIVPFHSRKKTHQSPCNLQRPKDANILIHLQIKYIPTIKFQRVALLGYNNTFLLSFTYLSRVFLSCSSALFPNILIIYKFELKSQFTLFFMAEEDCDPVAHGCCLQGLYDETQVNFGSKISQLICTNVLLSTNE